jgi:hypothetical protein
MEQQRDDDENVFKTFTDCLFSICILLSLLVVILGINVNTKVEQLTSPNEFSGGITRPEVYLSAYSVDYSMVKSDKYSYARNIYSNNPIVEFALDSASLAAAKTTVTFEGGTEKVTTADPDQSFSGNFTGTIEGFVNLATGIDIGSFSIGNETTAIAIPIFVSKYWIFEPSGTHFPASKDLAQKLLCWGWPSMCGKVYPVRAYKEYKDS